MTATRIQVILAHAGVASRRAAERYIVDGRVTVNGKVVRTLGAKADPAKDEIRLDGKSVGPSEEAATIVLYKPDLVVTTQSDPEGRETVRELVADEPYRFVSVGRLDFHAEGVLLLTTDGALAHRLMRARTEIPKVYAVKVAGSVPKRAVDRLRAGVELDDGITRPAVVEILEEDGEFSWLMIVVSESRNRLIRRMCDAIERPARRVVRTAYASVELGELRPGQYRYLGKAELAALYAIVGLPPAPPCSRAVDVGRAKLGTLRRSRGAIPGVTMERVGRRARRD